MEYLGHCCCYYLIQNDRPSPTPCDDGSWDPWAQVHTPSDVDPGPLEVCPFVEAFVEVVPFEEEEEEEEDAPSVVVPLVEAFVRE